MTATDRGQVTLTARNLCLAVIHTDTSLKTQPTVHALYNCVNGQYDGLPSIHVRWWAESSCTADRARLCKPGTWRHITLTVSLIWMFSSHLIRQKLNQLPQCRWERLYTSWAPPSTTHPSPFTAPSTTKIIFSIQTSGTLRPLTPQRLLNFQIPYTSAFILASVFLVR